MNAVTAPFTHKPIHVGQNSNMRRYRFKNGYGATVIHHHPGNNELAIIRYTSADDFTFFPVNSILTTGIKTQLNFNDVESLLTQISQLRTDDNATD